MSECYGSAVAEHAQASRDAAVDAADAREEAHHALWREFMKAMGAGDVAVLIRTPAWGPHRLTASLDDVLSNAISSSETWLGLIALALVSAKSSDDTVRLAALAWFSRVANDHAEAHADKLNLMDLADSDAPPVRARRPQ